MFEPFPDISERADSDMEEALSFQGSVEQDELDLNEPLNGLAELAASCLDKAQLKEVLMGYHRRITRDFKTVKSDKNRLQIHCAGREPCDFFANFNWKGASYKLSRGAMCCSI